MFYFKEPSSIFKSEKNSCKNINLNFCLISAFSIECFNWIWMFRIKTFQCSNTWFYNVGNYIVYHFRSEIRSHEAMPDGQRWNTLFAIVSCPHPEFIYPPVVLYFFLFYTFYSQKILLVVFFYSPIRIRKSAYIFYDKTKHVCQHRTVAIACEIFQYSNRLLLCTSIAHKTRHYNLYNII